MPARRTAPRTPASAPAAGNFGAAVCPLPAAPVAARRLPATGGLAAGLLLVLAAARPAVAQEFLGLTDTGSIVRFDAADPSVLLSDVAIAGLVPGEALVGIDLRRATDDVLALSDAGRLYRLAPLTGVATPIGAGPLATLAGSSFGLDVDPASDTLRIVSDADENLVVDPDAGTLLATDGALAWDAASPFFGADPHVSALAYGNPVAGTATAWALDVQDSVFGVLARLQPAAAGSLQGDYNSQVLGVASDEGGFEILPDGTAWVARTQGGVTTLVQLDLDFAVTIGDEHVVGGGAALTGLCAIPDDLDGDGFPNALEMESGSDYADAGSTLFDGQPAIEVPLDALVSKLAVKLNFAVADKDRITLSGRLPEDPGFALADAEGRTYFVDVGGVLRSFTLDAKGKSPKGPESFRLKGKVKDGTIGFALKLQKGNFAAALVDEGLSGAAGAKKVPVHVPVAVFDAPNVYRRTATLLWSAKAGKTGGAKLAKGG